MSLNCLCTPFFFAEIVNHGAPLVCSMMMQPQMIAGEQPTRAGGVLQPMENAIVPMGFNLNMPLEETKAEEKRPGKGDNNSYLSAQCDTV